MPESRLAQFPAAIALRPESAKNRPAQSLAEARAIRTELISAAKREAEQIVDEAAAAASQIEKQAIAAAQARTEQLETEALLGLAELRARYLLVSAEKFSELIQSVVGTVLGGLVPDDSAAGSEIQPVLYRRWLNSAIAAAISGDMHRSAPQISINPADRLICSAETLREAVVKEDPALVRGRLRISTDYGAVEVCLRTQVETVCRALSLVSEIKQDLKDYLEAENA